MNSPPEENDATLTCEFDDCLCTLREIPFFAGYALEALKVLAYLCVCENFRPGDYLFTQEEDDGNAFYIMSGQVELIRRDGPDKESLRVLAEGEFIGGLSLLGRMPRLFELRARTAVTCLLLTREKFGRTMEQFPDLVPAILRTVLNGVRGWEERLLADRSEGCEACRNNVGVSLI